MPLDLGHDPTWFALCCCLVAEAGMKNSDMVGRPSDGADQQMCNVLLQHRVGRQSDGVAVTFSFQKIVNLRLGKGGVRSEVAAKLSLAIAPDKA